MKEFRLSFGGIVAAIFILFLPAAWGEKPPLTLDDFFNFVYIRSAQISPDGHAVVVETARPDWFTSRFRRDLWLYRDAGGGSLAPLTQSGHDSTPEWSPNGLWIAFLSDRQTGAASKSAGDGDEKGDDKDAAQVYVISTSGGEAFPVTSGDEEVHAFAWSPDSRFLYFATRNPWTKEQKDAYKKEWHDVVRFRESERGDTIFSADAVAIREYYMAGASQPAKAPEPKQVATTPYRVNQISASPDGKRLAVATGSRSQREESHEPYGIYLADLEGGELRSAIRTQDTADDIRWSPDSRHVFFTYAHGRPDGPYEDPQVRLYWVDAAGGTAERWAMRFNGNINGYAVMHDGSVFAAGMLGTEIQPYVQSDPGGEFRRKQGWPGAFELPCTAMHSPRVAFVYSSLQRPTEVYIAESPDRLEQAQPITAFNRLLAERELPQGKPYRWAADDGASIEGMLIYPPGKFEAKHLPMFTFIHGGPADADGNYFRADWYQWSALAATQGWLVFEPNYRGSVGYGDAFTLGIIPHIVSRPGKDILEGIDALVGDNIADQDHLAIGGYSYGGYLTNWLITQTSRFKAAVTGAGSVEHVANWGNDDTTFDDAYFLGGHPWEAESNYDAEAAIWQIGKVATPTHIVAGSDDIRVYVGENYLLERALQTRSIPSSLLVFPGEGHGLDKNPWHGKIKVREELKWLEKYAGR